jgi:hypothetical protein
MQYLFDGTNVFRTTPLEVLDVQLFDESRQRQFPGFLPRVGKATKLLPIQAQLSRHLDVSMEKMVTLPRIDPLFFRYLFLLCQRASTYRVSVCEDPNPYRRSPGKHPTQVA